jgi:threonine dehydrogenase-like Zn-dependent dehydrogenase
MQAIVKTEKGEGHVELREVPVPEIGDGEVLIRIKAAAVCGTDLHILHDEFAYWPPVTLGHEFAGVIDAVGKDVKDWKAGDRVVGEPHTLACGTCYYCRTGNIQNCASKRSPGWGIDGCFAPYLRYPNPSLLHHLPDSIGFREGSLIEPLANVVTDVVERGKITAGDTVAVIGPGPIGLMAGIAAHACGAAKVILIGTEADRQLRIPLAKKLEVFDSILMSEKDSCSEEILKLTNGLGADLVVDASGSQGGIGTGIRLLRKYGTFVGIGLPARETIQFPYTEAMKKVLTIVCNMSTSYTSWERSISLMEKYQDKFSQLVTHVEPLTKWKECFDLLEAKQGMKVVFTP